MITLDPNRFGTHFADVRNGVRLAYAREGDPKDACVVDDLALKMTAGGYSVLNLITDLTQTDSFRTRVVEVP